MSASSKSSFREGESENFIAPSSTVSSPDNIEFHLILDLELDALTENKDSKIDSFIQTCLGAFLGFSPASVIAIYRTYVASGHDDKMGAIDFITCICFSACLFLVIVFNIINHGKNKSNKNLVEKIKERKKRTLSNIYQS